MDDIRRLVGSRLPDVDRVKAECLKMLKTVPTNGPEWLELKCYLAETARPASRDEALALAKEGDSLLHLANRLGLPLLVVRITCLCLRRLAESGTNARQLKQALDPLSARADEEWQGGNMSYPELLTARRLIHGAALSLDAYAKMQS